MPLFIAAANGHGDVVTRLLAAGAAVGALDAPRPGGGGRGSAAADQHGRTPLYYAAGAGHDDVVARLLAAGAAVDASSIVRPGARRGVPAHNTATHRQPHAHTHVHTRTEGHAHNHSARLLYMYARSNSTLLSKLACIAPGKRVRV